MTPSVIAGAARRADHERVRQDRAADIGRGARVVLYTSSDCWRGSGVSYIEIANALDACGFVPRILATNPVVAAEFNAAGLQATCVSGERGESMRLRAYLRRHEIAAVLVDRAHDLRVATIATLGRGSRVPVIFRYNHFRPRPPSDGLIRLAYRTTLREQVFLSSTARDRVLKDTPFMRGVAATTIHEGVDSREFRPNRRAAAEFRRSTGTGAQPFLLAVGALSPEKRYDVLFDALRLLRHRAPRLLLFGEGPQERELRARAEQLCIDVRFLGRVPRSQLIGAYTACSAFVHPGCVETFGLAVLEAMSCARPVIVSAGGALPEVVGRDGSCGTLIPPNSAWDLSGAIDRLLSEPERAARQGARARERATRHFSLTAMHRAYVNLAARHAGHRLIVGA
jgi:glycosyltransferase involved in cell wall biosynthesis